MESDRIRPGQGLTGAQPMTDAEEALFREYLDRLGAVAGAGPYPGDEPLHRALCRPADPD